MLPESLIDKDRPARWRGSENSILRPFQYPVLKVLARPFQGRTSPHLACGARMYITHPQHPSQALFREGSVEHNSFMFPVHKGLCVRRRRHKVWASTLKTRPFPAADILALSSIYNRSMLHADVHIMIEISIFMSQTPVLFHSRNVMRKPRNDARSGRELS